MGFSVEYIYRILDQYSGPLKRITEETKRFQEASKAAQEKAAKMGESMRNVGYKMTAGLTLPIVGAGIAAAKTAIDFQEAFTGVQKTVNATAPQLKRMETEFINLSKEIPISATELMKIGESAGQLGIETKNITSFTKTIAMLGATTNLSSEQGATQLARFANITGMSQENFDRLASTIVVLGNNLATSESEIVDMALGLAMAGKTVGLTEAQIMAFSGSLSSIGIESEAGSTAFSKAFYEINSAIGKNSPQLRGFAKAAGLSVGKFADLFKKDAAQGMMAFISGLGKMPKDKINLLLDALGFKDVRLVKAITGAALASDGFAFSLKLADKAWLQNTALAKEATLRFKTWKSQLIIVWNTVKILAAEFGKIIMPIFMAFVKYALLPMVWIFTKLPKPIKAVIVVFSGLIAVIGPLLIAAGLIIAKWGFISGVLWPAMLSVLSAVGAAFASVTWPVWATLAAVAALIGILILAWKKSTLFRESISNLADSLKPLTDSLSALVFWIANGLSNAFSASGKEISSWADIFRSIGDVIGTVINFIAAMVKTVLDSVAAMGKLAGAISTGNWKDAWQIATTGQSMFDIGKNAATRKEAARQDNKLEVSGQIGVSATGGAKVERAQIGLNQGYNLAVAR